MKIYETVLVFLSSYHEMFVFIMTPEFSFKTRIQVILCTNCSFNLFLNKLTHPNKQNEHHVTDPCGLPHSSLFTPL